MGEPDHQFKIEYDTSREQFVARLYGYFGSEMGWAPVLLDGDCLSVFRRLLGELTDLRTRNPDMHPSQALALVLERWWQAIPANQRGG